MHEAIKTGINTFPELCSVAALVQFLEKFINRLRAPTTERARIIAHNIPNGKGSLRVDPILLS